MTNRKLAWKTGDGLDIFGQVWEPDVIKPKAVICLVHGLGEHSSRYDHVAKALGRYGYVFYAFDLRGHGRSGGPRGHIPSIEFAMQDMDIFLEHAHADYPELPQILYGHSLGGILALYYGLTRRPNVKATMVTSPGMRTALEDQKAKLMLVKILGGLAPTLTIPSGLDPKTISRDPQVVQAYINDPLVHDKGTLGFAKTMIFNVNQWTLDHASEFRLPLLIMHGKKDDLAFPSGSIEFANALGQDRCTLVLWDDCYHEIHNEPEKEEVFKTMALWMNARLNE